MIIYLEGADGSGKTTLAKQIVKYCKDRDITAVQAEPLINTNPSRPNRVTSAELMDKLSIMYKCRDIVYVLDRGPISDCIYRLFDDYEPVIDYHYLRLSMEFMFKNTLLIYCRNNNMKKYVEERGDTNPIVKKYHDKIIRVYDMVIGNPFRFSDKNSYYVTYDFEHKECVDRTWNLIEAFIDDVINSEVE